MKRLARLFYEMLKIALFVVGGGYAIIVVADQVFGKKLKWLREGELLEHLPVFQMVPGLIAGNTAIYVGAKIAGRVGAFVALVAVAVPSFVIFLGVTCGYGLLPQGNVWLESAFLGLRAALAGLIFAAVLKGWRKSVEGWYGVVSVAVAAGLVFGLRLNTALVLVAGMVAGIVWTLCGGAAKIRGGDSAGLELAPLPVRQRLALGIAGALLLGGIAYFQGDVLRVFLKFGCLGFGGGYVLVPLYVEEFVGASAPLLQMPMADFSNLMALTQTTPGPVSINAATFFGYRLGGVLGSLVATAALLVPSYFLLLALLTGLERWKDNRIVQGLLGGVRPVTLVLILSAFVTFVQMSVFEPGTEGWIFHPFALALALFAGVTISQGRLSVMGALFLCGLAGCAVFPFWG
ncbi:MAG: chromate transporter [Kiritimatiellia bacterium]